MSLLQVHESLTDETILYRTLDFYSAANIIKDKKLMFSRADTFSDKNEGIDRLLRNLEVASPNSGCGFGWNDSETAVREHNKVKMSHYISCWSENPESVAMWSLYSADLCSVRISTTVGELKFAVQNLIKKYGIERLTEDNIGKQVVVASEARIAPVFYESLGKISKIVTRRSKATIKAHQRYIKNNGCPPPPFGREKMNYWSRNEQRRFKELRLTCNLKDKSFEHEAEVRVAVRLGSEILYKRILESKNYIDPNHEYHLVYLGDIESFGLLTDEYTTPPREFISCSDGFVKSVAIDPRCPKHKATFMIDWFKKHNIKIVDSTCFGYLPDTFESYPEW